MTQRQVRGDISLEDTEGDSPFISVVLPVRNEEATIESALRSRLALIPGGFLYYLRGTWIGVYSGSDA